MKLQLAPADPNLFLYRGIYDNTAASNMWHRLRNAVDATPDTLAFEHFGLPDWLRRSLDEHSTRPQEMLQ